MNQKTSSLVLPFKLTILSRVLFFIILSIFSFFIPFSFGHPQWLVGTIVNACLFLAVIFLPVKFCLPLIFLPSLGVLTRGIIFGPFTFFLIYFLPFIWLSNLILISVFKILFSKIKYIPSVFFASAMKFLFLFAVANIYFNFRLVPKIFLQKMGLFQLFTALAGGIISFAIFNILYGKRNVRN